MTDIECAACGSAGAGPHEYDVHCENCGEYLGHYCYGIFDPADVCWNCMRVHPCNCARNFDCPCD